MRISFDLDNTAWKYKEILAPFARLLRQSGHEIGILTAHGNQLKNADIKRWNGFGFPELDFYISNPGKEKHGEWKARMMEEKSIDIHFDDFDGGAYEEEFLFNLDKYNFPLSHETVRKVVRIE